MTQHPPYPGKHVPVCRCKEDEDGNWGTADMRCLAPPERRIIEALIAADRSAKARKLSEIRPQF